MVLYMDPLGNPNLKSASPPVSGSLACRPCLVRWKVQPKAPNIDPPNYPLIYPKYPLLRTHKGSIQSISRVHGVAWEGYCIRL